MAKFRVRERTIHSIECPDGTAFEVNHRPSEAVEPVARSLPGGRTVVGYAADESDDPHDPREDDNLGVMVCWHRRYKLGDRHEHKDAEVLWADLLEAEYDRLQAASSEAIEDFVARHRLAWDDQRTQDYQAEVDRDFGQKVQDALKARGYVILPLHLLDHSGLAMSTGSFRHVAPGGWDSGQVGFIYAGPEQIQRMGTPPNRVERCLRAEVEEYDRYLRGECYGICLEVFGQDGRRIEASALWGHLGTESARRMLQQEVEAVVKAHW